MARYAITILTRSSDTSWDVLTTEERSLRAQKNPRGLRQDVIDQYAEQFTDNETMDEGTINRAANTLCRELTAIDGDEAIMSDVMSTLRRILDEDMVEIEDMDILDFLDVSIDIDQDALVRQIEECKAVMDMDFVLILDAVGTIVYEVRDPDTVLVGKVILNWLEG